MMSLFFFLVGAIDMMFNLILDFYVFIDFIFPYSFVLWCPCNAIQKLFPHFKELHWWRNQGKSRKRE